MRKVHQLPMILLILLSTNAHASSVRKHVDLSLGSAGAPRIVGYDDSQQRVRLATFTSSGWDCYLISDGYAMAGQHLSSGDDGAAVVDAGGTPYVAYPVFKNLMVQDPLLCGTTQVLRTQLWLQKGVAGGPPYQVCIDSTGSLVGCVNVSDQGIGVALARTSDGRIHAAYLEGQYSLRYAVSNTGVTAFTSEPVAAAEQLPSSGRSISIAIDATGTPHIGYYRGGAYRYLVKTAIGWSEVALTLSAYPSGYEMRPRTGISFALDGSGLANITIGVGDSTWHYRENSLLQLSTPELISDANNPGAHPSMARATNGNIHVAYLHKSGEGVFYTVKSGSSWSTPIMIVNHSSPLGFFSGRRLSIALTNGPPQLPRIAYPSSDPGGGYAVWLAEFDGSIWSSSIQVPCSPPPPPHLLEVEMEMMAVTGIMSLRSWRNRRTALEPWDRF